MVELTDKQSHYLQNEIDVIKDTLVYEFNLKNQIWIPKLLEKLEELRDEIPCSCGDKND